MQPRTIYDPEFAIRTSTRYAHDQEALLPLSTRDSSQISRQVEVSVTTTSYFSEFELALGLSSVNTAFGLVEPPEDFMNRMRTLFTTQVLPRFGSEEKQMALLTKIEEIKSKYHLNPTNPEQLQDIKGVEEEKIKAIKFLNCVTMLDRVKFDVYDYIRALIKG